MYHQSQNPLFYLIIVEMKSHSCMCDTSSAGNSDSLNIL